MLTNRTYTDDRCWPYSDAIADPILPPMPPPKPGPFVPVDWTKPLRTKSGFVVDSVKQVAPTSLLGKTREVRFKVGGSTEFYYESGQYTIQSGGTAVDLENFEL